MSVYFKSTANNVPISYRWPTKVGFKTTVFVIYIVYSTHIHPLHQDPYEFKIRVNMYLVVNIKTAFNYFILRHAYDVSTYYHCSKSR